MLSLLRDRCGLRPEHTVADIASGTGIFTRLLLENGNRAIGVEPNADMRKASLEFLARYPNFISVEGTAEATTLPDRSVYMATAAQAAHWFDRPKARREFSRILQTEGWAVLLWNDRRLEGSAFAHDYENLLLAYGKDYRDVQHQSAHTLDALAEFYSPAKFHTSIFPSYQDFDYAGLEGRLLSSSYTPERTDPQYEPMLRELKRIFTAHQKDSVVKIEYDTRVYYGHLT